MPGVLGIDLDLVEGIVVVDYDPSRVGAGALIAAVRDGARRP